MKRLLCSSNFSTSQPTFKTKHCGKIWFFSDYIIGTGLFKLTNWHQPFILKSNFHGESSNHIRVIICSGCNKEYIRKNRGQLKERLSRYRQHIPQPEYEKLEVERHLRTCAKRTFEIFPFIKKKGKKQNFKRTLRISFH